MTVSNATTMLKIASSQRSRRAVLGGLATALLGASVPAVAAAQALSGDDAELLSRCAEWHRQRGRVKRLGKAISRAHDIAEAKKSACATRTV